MYEDFNNSDIYNNNEDSGNSVFIPEGPQKPKKKKGGMAKKAALITAAALLFGTVSGGTMVGVNMVADYYNRQQNPARTELTTAPAETEAAADGSDGGSQTVSSTRVSAVLDVSDIVEKAMPSVVAINNKMLLQSNNWFFGPQQYEATGAGSGIIIGQNDTELLIVTNNHVVENSEDLQVVFIDNQAVEAKIKGTDVENDLAVVAVPLENIPADTMSQISIATMGDSDSLKVGQGVIAIGNALGYGQSVTVGYISALDREVRTSDDNITRNLLQTDAAINPGNSGGALLNMQGQLVGINSAKQASTEVEGMGYAIPVSEVQSQLEGLMNRTTREKVDADKQGSLGVSVQDVDSQVTEMYGIPEGVYVAEVTKGSAAEKAGIKQGYIITEFDGESVKSASDLKNMLQYYKAGEKVEMKVQVSDGGGYEEQTVTVTLDQAQTENR